MTTLLIAEHEHAALKDSTNKALTAAKQLGGDDVALAVRCNVANADEVDTLLKTAVDRFGNVVPGYSKAVDLTSTDPLFTAGAAPAWSGGHASTPIAFDGLTSIGGAGGGIACASAKTATNTAIHRNK